MNRESSVMENVGHERNCSKMINVDGTIAGEGECIDNEQNTSSDKYQAALTKQSELAHLRKLILPGLRKPIEDLYSADYTNEVIPRGARVANSTALPLFSRFICSTIMNKPKFQEYTDAAKTSSAGDMSNETRQILFTQNPLFINERVRDTLTPSQSNRIVTLFNEFVLNYRSFKQHRECNDDSAVKPSTMKG